jgi:hypothetical protein
MAEAMSRAVQTTRLGRIQIALSEALIESLKGEPLLDGVGAPIIIDGKVLLGPPKTGNMKEAREYLKDMGITEEPEEAESRVVLELAASVSKYEDDQDALLNQAALQIEKKE